MRDETDDIDWSGSEKAAAVGDGLGQRLEKLSKLWEPKEEEGVDLSPGGAESPEGQLKAAFDKASVNPEEVPSVATGDAPKAGEKPPRPTEPWAAIEYDLEQNASRKPSVDPLAEKMKAAGWAPKESSPPPDWEALQRNLQHAQDTANATRLGQQSFAAVSGFHADPNAGAADIASAKAPLEIAQERQAYEAKQREADAHLLSQREQMAQKDPASPESVKARARVKALYADTGKLPPDFESYTAADVAPLMGALPAIEKNQSEEGRTSAKAKEAEKAKVASLVDRKKTMLSLYPEHEKEISALNDLGDAQTLQTALEGRAGRESSQTAAEKARQETQAHSDREAAVASARALQNQLALKDYESKHQPLTAEQKTQYEAFGSVDAALNNFEKDLHSVEGQGGKLASQFPAIAGAMGIEGASFPAARKTAASLLVRAIDGSVVRPQTLEQLEHMMPLATDSAEKKAEDMARLRRYMHDKQKEFLSSLQSEGARVPLQDGAPETRKIKGGGTAYRGLRSGKWFDNAEEAGKN